MVDVDPLVGVRSGMCRVGPPGPEATRPIKPSRRIPVTIGQAHLAGGTDQGGLVPAMPSVLAPLYPIVRKRRYRADVEHGPDRRNVRGLLDQEATSWVIDGYRLV